MSPRDAVVVGVDLNGLGVVRSLAAAGARVFALDTDLAKPTMRSRFGIRRRIRALHGSELVEDLLALARTLPGPAALFLTQEQTVSTVSRWREELLGAYRFVLPPAEVLASLMSKDAFQELGERLGAPLPRTLRLRGNGDAQRLGQLRWPCVLKPAARTPAYEQRFKKAYKVQGPDEAARLWAEVRHVAPVVIVQEWIAGADDAIYFCLQYRDAAGACIASFEGRKIRAWPPQVGGTASCTVAPAAVAAALRRLTDAFFTASGCVGMASMEYKQDARTGDLLMVEPTVGRTDHQEEVATLNGVNIPAAALASLMCCTPPLIASPAAPQIWRDPLADRWSASGQRLPGFPEGRVRDAYFRLNDPGPWLHLVGRHIGQRVRRRLPMWPRPAVREAGE